MIETVATQLKAIAFERDIQRLTENFTGREWVFKEIDRWLQQENQRFFILTGEPGVGKSASAAQLTQTRKDIAAYHFCIARQISTVEPNNVLLSLAAQLIKYFPDYGEALVNTVKPLFLQVNIEINIENIRDSVVQGVVIENLHIHYPKQALDIVLRQALAALPNPPKEPVSILLDSLDEAVTYSNENNLVTLLSSVDDLPSWVRFILTSRPDKQRVLSYFETLKPYYYHLNELSEKNKKDIHDYVDKRVVSEPIQAQIQRFQVQSETLINQITELSQGNFLYTKVLLDDIELGGQPIDNLAALPKSLNELYHNFLLRLKAEWEGKYQPIFGILTVTKAPVTEEELANLLSEQLNETELGQRLRVVQQFLDVVQNYYAENTYTLFHQSLQDYLVDKEKSGVFHCSPKDAHRQIIEYCWQYHPRDWRECDHYGLRYLATHLVDMATLEKPPIKARKYIKRLHELLATEVNGRNVWFDAKDRIGDTAGFLRDIELAWKQIDAAFALPEDFTSIGLQCRYAFIMASVRSLVKNVPVELLKELVKRQVWTPEQGLVYIQQISEPWQKAEILSKLAPHLPETLREQASLEILRVTQSIEYESSRVEALIKLAPHLPIALQEQAFLDAFQVAQSIKYESYRVEALIKLAPHLPIALQEQAFLDAFQVAQSIKYESYRVEALIRLTPHLVEARVEALKAIRAIRNESERAKNLGFIAPYLIRDLALEAIEEIKIIHEEHHRGDALAALIPHLPAELLPEALEAALEINKPTPLARALAALAVRVPEVRLRALATALEIKNKSIRAEVLIALCPHLLEVLPQAIEAVQLIQDGSGRAKTLIALAPHLTDNLLSKALQVARSIPAGSNRAKALITLVQRIPEALSEALKEVKLIQDIPERAKALAVLSLYQPNTLSEALSEILDVAQSIEDERSRAAVLNTLAEHLPDTFIPKALEIAQAIRDQQEQTNALSALAAYIPELLPKALEVARLIQKETERSKAIATLSAYEPDKLSEALRIARTIPNLSESAKVLAALSPYLPETLPYESLEVALQIPDKSERTRVLTVLIPHLSDGLLPKVIEGIREIGWTLNILSGLVALAPYLSEKLLSEVLTLVQETIGSSSKATEVQQQIQNAYNQARAEANLTANLPMALPEAIEVIQTIKNKKERANALSIWASRMAEDLNSLSSSFEMILFIKSEASRAEFIASLAPRLPKTLLPNAFHAAQLIQSSNDRTTALAALTPHLAQLSPVQLAPLWQHSVRQFPHKDRKDLLQEIAVLVPIVKTLGNQQGVAEVAHAIQCVTRWWS